MAAAERRTVVGELKRGRESAVQLREELAESSVDGGRLAEEVVASFSRALEALEQAESAELCQEASSISSTDIKRTKKKKKPRLGGEGKRTLSQQWTVTSATLEDGGTWRKYGQKPIRGVAYPRNYYKCSHKQGQGCQATSRVQKLEENPASFLITYMGHHSCKDAAGRVPAAGAGEDDGEPFLINFGSTKDCADEDDTVGRSNITRNVDCSDIFALPELSPAPETTVAQLDDVFNFDSAPFIFG